MNRTDNVTIAMIERQMLGEQFSRIRMPITTTMMRVQMTRIRQTSGRGIEVATKFLAALNADRKTLVRLTAIGKFPGISDFRISRETGLRHISVYPFRPLRFRRASAGENNPLKKECVYTRERFRERHANFFTSETTDVRRWRRIFRGSFRSGRRDCGWEEQQQTHRALHTYVPYFGIIVTSPFSSRTRVY